MTFTLILVILRRLSLISVCLYDDPGVRRPDNKASLTQSLSKPSEDKKYEFELHGLFSCSDST